MLVSDINWPMDGLDTILSVIIFDPDYSKCGLSSIGLDQCILLLVVLAYHFISVIKLLLLLICWFLSFLLLLVCKTLLHLAHNNLGLVWDLNIDF